MSSFFWWASTTSSLPTFVATGVLKLLFPPPSEEPGGRKRIFQWHPERLAVPGSGEASRIALPASRCRCYNPAHD